MDYNNIYIKRRNLPHWHKDKCIQFVTFHLADSLPASVRSELQSLKTSFLKSNPEPWTLETTAQYNKLFPTKVNEYLDAGYGGCCLKHANCAKVMADALDFFDGDRYILHRYVIMPNHVHMLVELNGCYNLSNICKSWKNFSALQINKIMKLNGKLWHHESWDRMIRNERHYNNVIAYIEKNIQLGGVIWK